MSLTSAARTSLWSLELVVFPLELVVVAAAAATRRPERDHERQGRDERPTPFVTHQSSSLPSVLVWESDA